MEANCDDLPPPSQYIITERKQGGVDRNFPASRTFQEDIQLDG
jgi:hypothetical protein